MGRHTLTTPIIEEGRMAEYMDVVAAIISSGALLIILYGPWQTHCEDRARQHLFEARNQIFDLALGGGIRFNSREYRAIRQGLNCLIRYAHQASWWRLAAYLIFIGMPTGAPDAITAADKIGDEKAKNVVYGQLAKAMTALTLLFIHRAPVLWLPMAIIGVIGRGSPIVKKERRKWEYRVQANAEACCGDVAA